MKIQTTELTGVPLDWVVATLEGERPAIMTEPDCGQGAHRPLGKWCAIRISPAGHELFSPSTAWAHGGPIIEREKMEITWRADEKRWCASLCYDRRKDLWAIEYATTPLIAAMRCYVASKLGHEVDVPDDIN